jgi:hypothetical protein
MERNEEARQQGPEPEAKTRRRPPDPAVVRSLVERGDLSALTPKQKVRLYNRICRELGLNPDTQPLAFLMLDGREVLYPTRGATDQLAAIHRIDREIVDGPKVAMVGGQEVMIATCKATHPDGRVDMSTGCCPLTDPVMAPMWAETKAKRRATLSILGLGMLDESEVALVRSPAAHGRPARTDAEGTAPAGEPPCLDAFLLRMQEMEQPSDAVDIWIRHRARFGASEKLRKAGWSMLCQQLTARWQMRDPGTWLQDQISSRNNGMQQ